MAGEILKPDAPVDLVLSKGRRPIEIKDWTGEDAEQATTALEKRKLVVEVTGEEFSDTVDEGDVISQNPTAGPLYKGDTVQLVVSRGPELVEVPAGRREGGRGRHRASSRRWASRSKVEESDNYIGVGFVFGSDPDAGVDGAQGLHDHALPRLNP